METFEQQLDELLKNGKTVEAKKLIQDLVSQPIDEKTQGAIAFNKAMVYIRAKNELNKTFIQKAQAILAELNEIEKLSSEDDKNSKIDEIRKKIQGM